MKKTVLFLVCILLCGVMAACGGPDHSASSSQSDVSGAEGSTQQGFVDRSTPSEGTEGLTPRQAYAESLLLLMNHNILPNGQETGPVISVSEMNSTFAVADVDGDGREELVLQYTDTFSAGQMGMISEYNPEAGTMKTELTEAPFFTFYENGLALAKWSHNQGKAGDFWPYTLYRHDPETDQYTFHGSVDAWEQKSFPDGYPAELDTSGSGYLYYLCDQPPMDWDTPVDLTVYEQWKADHLAGAKELDVNFLPLNEQNIRQITEQAD